MFRFDRRLIQNFDWVILLLVIAVATMCLMNLYSAIYPNRPLGTPVYIKQLYFFIMGFGLILIIVSLDYRIFMDWNYSFYWAIIFLLLYALFLGRSQAGTQRWIDLGFFNLQPSELAKLGLVITLASYYSRKHTEEGFDLRGLIAPIGLTLLPFLLILKQPDLGTALMLGFIFVSMTLFVKLKWQTLAFLLGVCVSCVPIAWKFILKPYQRQRIETFLNPEADPLQSGYHILQSKIAVGSGLTFGKGYLNGTQGHLDFLPERHTDFAFSIWAEEWGFTGSLFFLAIYFSMILWGLNIAASSRDKFGTLLCLGIVSLMFWQAFINLAMVMGIMPVVGMPLPLYSYGGSSLITTMAGIGIMMSVRMRRYQVPG